jgi:hypothetical protein
MSEEAKYITFKRLPKEEFRGYMYAPPLEVPPGYSAIEAFRKVMEKGDRTDYEIAARKVCRLIIEAAEKNEVVKGWLLRTQQLGDDAWNKLMYALGRETAEIAKQINDLGPNHDVLNWCVFSAAYILG